MAALPAFTIASVSYLNAKPLIHGLDADPSLRLMLQVPSALEGSLRSGQCDVALLPVIDYQRIEGLRIIPAGGIGCDGPTLTVRIFSHVPIADIERLATDTDSHTSVALARIILADRYGIHPEFLSLRPEARTLNPSSDAILLIGDKVVCQEPPGMPHQLDLGAAWKLLTGMPFVFAVWVARPGVDLGGLAQRLDRARREGLADIPRIVREHATPRGWPPDVATAYLSRYLRYDIGAAQLQAMAEFWRRARRHDLIEHEPWPVAVA